MRIKCFVLCAIVAMIELKPSSGIVHLRLGGGRTPARSPSPRPNSNMQRDTEGSGNFDEEEHFHPKQLYLNTNDQISKCGAVENFIATDSGDKCPRGWLNAPECDKPDRRDIGVCRWEEMAEFELPNKLANLRGVLCKSRRMRCLSQAGVIAGDTQLLHAPRNALSEKVELKEILSHLSDLVVVDLARNDFTHLKDETFVSNKCLRSVNFDQNFLLDVPENLFSGNKDLTSVSMVGNHLDYLPPRIFQRNPYLTLINFERNNITRLAPEIFRHNRKLEVIRLEGNSIPRIPSELFSTNPLLREVGLAHNRISAIPKLLFRSARNLRNVNLSGNKLKKVPSHLFDSCAELRTIMLDRNILTTLPAKLFDRNLKLSLVDISYNRFHVVNPDLFVNNPVVAIVNKQWKDQQGVLEEEDEQGKWLPSTPHLSQAFYRKSILRDAR